MRGRSRRISKSTARSRRRRTVLVAGATGGLGPAIVRRLSESQAFDLVLCQRRRVGVAGALAKRARALGARVLVQSGDLLDTAFVRRLAMNIRRSFGGLDAVVLAVGDLHLGPALATTSSDLGRQMRSNVHAPWNCVRATVGLLERRRGGTIVFFGMAGASAPVAKRRIAAHAAAKAALGVLARALARELAPKGITVLTIAPGVVKTPRSKRGAVEPFAPAVPAGRVNTPEEVAAVVEFALSKAARPLTGAELPVANGFGL